MIKRVKMSYLVYFTDKRKVLVANKRVWRAVEKAKVILEPNKEKRRYLAISRVEYVGERDGISHS